ncbi:RHS repeat-associated core domain-containing protein [Gemmatimonas aurantiaca]|uniref:RHS repeat-associated core domain-containing protein n=1 Tax=Gemmatimonas aurantiaca TaxID=173480 RepID=UPI00301DF8D9
MRLRSWLPIPTALLVGASLVLASGASRTPARMHSPGPSPVLPEAVAMSPVSPAFRTAFFSWRADNSVTVTPTTNTISTGSVTVTVIWCGYPTGPTTYMDIDSRVIKVNNVDVTGDFDLQANPAACGFTGSVADEVLYTSTGTVTVNSTTGPVTVYADVGNALNYHWTDYRTYYPLAPRADVQVRADAQFARITGNDTARFTVTNAGNAPDTISLAVATCTGVVSSCTVTPSSTILASGASATAKVAFSASGSTGQAGLVRLRATNAAATAKDSAWADRTLAATPSVGVTFVGAAPGRTDNALRDACVTVALVDEAASECGDLRLTHALPGVRTMGQWRTPTLFYASQHARPRPLVLADVRLSAGVAVPPNVTACIKVSGANRGCTQYSGSAWGAPGNTRRVAVLADTGGWSTGITDVTLEVSASNGNQGPYTASGQVFVVDRRSSPFGAGWWLAGLEQLQVVSSTVLVWIGGDGSLRKYVKSGSVWHPTAFGVKDSILANGTGYVRVTAASARVFFNSTGQHDSTVNVRQHVTRFTWASGALTRIQFPTVSGTVEDTLFYSSGRLDSARAPNGRTLRVFRSGVRIDSLRDPDNSVVRFASGSGLLTNVVTTRTDRLGNGTTFSYDAGNRLTQAARPVSSTIGLTPAETRGLSTPVPVDSAYAVIDGPRSDVDDLTRYWVNGYGAPTRVRAADGQETFLRYHGTFVGLVDSTMGAERLVSVAHYTTRGLPDTVRTIQPFGSGNDARTTYLWHATTNQLTSRRTLTSGAKTLVDTLAYNSDSTLQWTQVGPDSARRVRYTYTAQRLPATLVLKGAGGTETSTFAYSTAGNLRKSVTPLGYLSLQFQDEVGRDTLVFTPRGTGTGATDSATLRTAGVRQHTWYDRQHRDTLTRTIGPRVTLPNSRVVIADTVQVRTTFDAEGQRLTVTREFTAHADTTGGGLYSSNPTEWDYDALGRVTRYKEASVPGSGGSNGTRFVLDAAGNATQTITPRNDTLRATYDALGRVVRRIVPQTTFSSPLCHYPVSGSCLYGMPDVEGPSQCIAVDTARFAYTEAGLLRRAENNWAKVRRTYYPNGQVAYDTLLVRRYETDAPASCGGSDRHAAGESAVVSDWSSHTYALRYEYDLAGRRTVLHHPDQLDPCTGRCAQTYAYHDQSGTLDTLVHPSTTGGTLTTRFTYDGQGRWITRSSPGSVSATRTFDADGRVDTRGGPLTNDALSYDAANLLTGGSTTVPATAASLSPVFAYSGLGALQYASGLTPALTSEEFKTDALGNRVWIRDDQAIDNVDRTRYQGVDAQTGQLVTSTLGTSPCGAPGLVQRSCHPTWYVYELEQEHDAAGNQIANWGRDTRGYSVGTAQVVPSETRSFYDAAQQLTYFNRHVGPLANSEGQGVFEEYRYDALGRRVFVRSRRPSTCSSPCEAYVQRTVWDGDQVLYEIRSSGGTGVNPVNMELEGGAQTGETVELYGIVVYAHAQGLDEPVGVLKRYATSVGAGSTAAYVTPYASYQGAWSYGTNASGTTCVAAGAACPAWPGYVATVDGRAPGADVSTVAVWWGDLLRGPTTTGGPQYLRNRYYDATTGQFTQADPIGLAGGLNLYGFGSGDPVNYRDPMGLCPVPSLCLAAAGAILGGGGRVLLNLTIDRPWKEGVLETAVGGALIGASFGLAAPEAASALFSRAAGSAVSVATASAGTTAGALRLPDANKLHHVFAFPKHKWALTGLSRQGNLQLINEVAGDVGNLVSSVPRNGGQVLRYQAVVNGHTIGVKVFEMSGARELSNAWVVK